MKVSHRLISLDLLDIFLKRGIPKARIIENPLSDGSFRIHSYIDYNTRLIHLFFVDPINGIELPEGADIRTIPIETTDLFLMNEEEKQK
jgi:hypothetical protein